MGYTVKVDSKNFTTEVIKNSCKKPILIDLFAICCAPRKFIKYILESILKGYDFILAKIGIDQDPQLTQQYQVEGVPDLKIAVTRNTSITQQVQSSIKLSLTN